MFRSADCDRLAEEVVLDIGFDIGLLLIGRIDWVGSTP
jgi:hypothetical protein